MAVSSPVPAIDESAAEFSQSILDKLTYACGKTAKTACEHDWYMATALAARDRVVDHWIDSQREVEAKHGKRVYYLSVEFLIGRLLFDTLTNLRMVDTARSALAALGVDLDHLRKLEPDAALGNGGLGRLAACYMDSMAALAMPAYGYGIRYEHGLFMQQIRDGWQHELPDDWLAFGNPWEFERPEIEYSIRFGGTVEYVAATAKPRRASGIPAERVLAVAYDTPVTGWRGRHVNTLRLWSARATSPLHLAAFNQGDYVGAMAAARRRKRSRACSIRATPRRRDRSCGCGRSISSPRRRCRTSCDAICSDLEISDLAQARRHPAQRHASGDRGRRTDAHPGRRARLRWDDAWRITKATLSYTNHTLLPEALESWSVALLNRLLPRHLQIIYLINWLHLDAAASQGVHDPKVHRLDLAYPGRRRTSACGWGTWPSSARTRSTACRRCTPS